MLWCDIAWMYHFNMTIKSLVHHECEGGIEKSIPLNHYLSTLGISRITDWHYEACRVMTVIPRDGFFYPTLTRLMDSFSCSALNTSFYIGKTWKRLPENPEYAEMRHGDVILAFQKHHGMTCGCSFVIFPTGWYRYVRSHMGQNNGNHDLVCEKEFSHMGETAENFDLVFKKYCCLMHIPICQAGKQLRQDKDPRQTCQAQLYSEKQYGEKQVQSILAYDNLVLIYVWVNCFSQTWDV